MKVAILTNQSRVSPVFETACSSLVIDVIESQCVIRSIYFFKSKNEIEMVSELLNKNIQQLICGAIPYYLEQLLIDQGCDVLSFIAGDLNEVIQALRKDLLNTPQFKMPGCKNKQRRKKGGCKRNASQLLTDWH